MVSSRLALLPLLTHRLAAVLLCALAASSPGRLPAADGTLDPSFGNGAGIRPINYDLGGDLGDYCGDTAGAPDGTLIVGGSSASQTTDLDWMLSRLAPNGATLSTRQIYFDLGGTNQDQLNTLAFDAAGRALVAGWADSADRRELRVCRLAAGSLDNDAQFNSGACFAYDLGASNSLEAYRIAPAPDGGILVAGSLLQPISGQGDWNWFVLKLTALGAIDADFGFFGLRVLAWNLGGLTQDDLFDMAVDPRSGAIFVAGEASQGGFFRGRVAKLSAAGNLDLSFGGTGYADLLLYEAGVPQSTRALGIALDPVHGTIWTALESDHAGSSLLALTGIGPAGELSAPVQWSWTSSPSGGWISRLLRQSDGKLLVVGSSGGAGNIVVEAGRFTPVDTTLIEPDASFGTNGQTLLDLAALSWGSGHNICSGSLASGKLVIVGDLYRPDLDQVVVRLTSTLTFADGFETADAAEWSAVVP